MRDALTVTDPHKPVWQCQAPRGWIGRLLLRNMNARHARLTEWALARVTVERRASVLDIGCGGGRALGMLAQLADLGKVLGVDHSAESVAVSRKVNQPVAHRKCGATTKVRSWRNSCLVALPE